MTPIMRVVWIRSGKRSSFIGKPATPPSAATVPPGRVPENG